MPYRRSHEKPKKAAFSKHNPWRGIKQKMLYSISTKEVVVLKDKLEEVSLSCKHAQIREQEWRGKYERLTDVLRLNARIKELEINQQYSED